MRMKSRLRLLLATGLLVGVAFPARAEIERTVEKTFAADSGGTLWVETRGGEISVVSSADPVVKVVAHERIRAGTEAKADRLLRSLVLTLDQRGYEITATARYRRSWFGLLFGSRPAVQVDFVVTVPANFGADLRTSEGKITVGNLGGAVRARTAGADISLGIIGGAVDARTSGAGIALDDGRGTVKLSTSRGDLAVGHAGGPAALATSGGDIRVGFVENAIQATTRGGNIRVGFVGPLRADSALTTSGGGVKIDVDPTAAFRLDASASGGQVDVGELASALTTTKRGHNWLIAAANGGGPRLRLRASGDDVVVRAR